VTVGSILVAVVVWLSVAPFVVIVGGPGVTVEVQVPVPLVRV